MHEWITISENRPYTDCLSVPDFIVFLGVVCVLTLRIGVIVFLNFPIKHEIGWLGKWFVAIVGLDMLSGF